jgi:hypothetical protein
VISDAFLRSWGKRKTPLVFDAIVNMFTEVRDVDRIQRILDSRVSQIRLRAKATAYPDIADRLNKRADEYEFWIDAIARHAR